MINNSFVLLINSTISFNKRRPYTIPENVKLVMVIGYLFILVSGVTGNSFVLYVTAFKSRLKNLKVYNTQIISLAIADLIGSLFSPLVMVTHLKSHSWEDVGDVGCKTLPAMNLLASLASGWTIVLIAFSRLKMVRVSFPQNQKGNKMDLLRICGAWLLSVIITSPYSYHLSYSSKYKICMLKWTAEKQFIFAGLFVTFTNILPILILTILHVSSVVLMRRAIPQYKSTFTERRKKQIKHIANTFTVITCTFFVLTVPYMGLYMKLAYNRMFKIPAKNYHFYLHYGLYFVSCLNSIVNPYFYVKHMQIRKWLRIILRALQCLPDNKNNNRKDRVIRQRSIRRRSRRNIADDDDNENISLQTKNVCVRNQRLLLLKSSVTFTMKSDDISTSV